MDTDRLMFFDRRPEALPLYENWNSVFFPKYRM